MPALCMGAGGEEERESATRRGKRKARWRARRSELGAETRKWVRAWGSGLGPPSPSQLGCQRPAGAGKGGAGKAAGPLSSIGSTR